ncbi:MAG: ATP synthase F1 subunit delta, partial [Clostridia bacterium]|nr:ATP synthase F1 subunit delta [Clostridia bacterium]
MIPKKTAKEYSDALYDLAEEISEQDTFLSQLRMINGIFKENPEYQLTLSSPQIPLSERQNAVEEVLGDSLHEYVLSFLQILIGKRVIRSFDDIFDAFEARYNKEHGIIKGTVISAIELTIDQRKSITEKISKKYEKTFDPVFTVDPSILGGIIIKIDNKLIDG